MRLPASSFNPFIMGLVSVLAAGPLAGAQTPTQAAPATQTTPPNQSGPAVPGTSQAAPAGTPPLASAPSSAPSVPLPAPSTSSGAAAPNAPGISIGIPQTGADSGAGQAAGTSAPLGGALSNEPSPLTATEIIGGREAGAVPASGKIVTLDEALKAARANEPNFNLAATNAKNAGLDRSIARAALLPNVIAHNQYLYTQSAGANTSVVAGSTLGPAPRFIANNAVHEYVTQGSATETIGLASFFALSRANALAALAKAQLELSRRGLNATVISLFYAASTTQGKVLIQQRALAEAEDFLKVTRERETAREVARADVLKAELTEQQRRRDLADAELLAAKAKLDLAVLLFADPTTPYAVALPPTSAPPPMSEVRALASAANSPQIASANAFLLAQTYALGSAQAAYLPQLSLNYSYGIDSTNYALKARDGNRNLGYSASATLDLPIFDWFATPNRIRQAHNLRDSAKLTLSAAQRTQTVQTREFYNEVQTAYAQLDSLKHSVSIAQESLHLTRLRYTAGEATVLEVTDAENTLATTESLLNDGTTRYQLALANLQLLTGTI